MSSTKARQRHTDKQKHSEEKIPKKKLQDDKIARKSSRRWILAFLIALSATLVIPVLILIAWPSPVEPVIIEGLSEPPELIGPLEANNVLESAEQIYVDKVEGPESIVVDGDHIYTGTADGWVNHIHKGVVQKIATFGKEPCGGYLNENTCGRPLGMRMDKDGFLIVADAYYGLFKLNVVTGDYVPLHLSTTPINGKEGKLINDLDIAPDGKIYFSDSSTKWHRNQFLMILFEGVSNGRLLMYDPATGSTTELLNDLLFANGVQLTKDKSAVLISETFKARILKYDLKTKQVTVWADNLPGFPDNIRYSKVTGTYWVGLAWNRQKGKFSLGDFLAPRPWLRSILAKVLSIKDLLILKKYFGSTDTKTTALELNEAGTIIRSIHDKTGEVIVSISEVESSDGVMYFGSYYANYIGRLYRKNVPGL
uniref:Strictosidine synthase conserved region domain-containing protein n=1 Tax=Arion vulgaris TaxID=1028688 RepID=A0A0B7A1Q4_9EUPU